jgi:hypothetical protein
VLCQLSWAFPYVGAMKQEFGMSQAHHQRMMWICI